MNWRVDYILCWSTVSAAAFYFWLWNDVAVEEDQLFMRDWHAILYFFPFLALLLLQLMQAFLFTHSELISRDAFSFEICWLHNPPKMLSFHFLFCIHIFNHSTITGSYLGLQSSERHRTDLLGTWFCIDYLALPWVCRMVFHWHWAMIM